MPTPSPFPELSPETWSELTRTAQAWRQTRAGSAEELAADHQCWRLLARLPRRALFSPGEPWSEAVHAHRWSIVTAEAGLVLHRMIEYQYWPVDDPEHQFLAGEDGPHHPSPASSSPSSPDTDPMAFRTSTNSLASPGAQTDETEEALGATALPAPGAFAPMAACLWPSLLPLVQAEARACAGSGAGSAARPSPITIAGSHSWIPAQGTRTHFMLPLVVLIAANGCHTYLVSGAGTGKSHLATQVAQALNREHEVDSFSSQTTEARILGFVDAQGQPVITPFARAYEHGRLFVGDEADAGSAPSVAMNRAMANDTACMASRLLTRHPDFLVIATANTRGSGQAEGFRREPQDAALLDRFFMLELLPDPGLERHLCGLPPSQTPAYKSPALDLLRGGAITAEEWFQFSHRARQAADKLQIRATFKTSSRPMAIGAKLAMAGVGKYWLAQGLLRRNLGTNDWDKLASALDIEP